MKAPVTFFCIALVFMTPSASLLAQESSAANIDQLKAQMNSQQKVLEQQQAHIEALESALAEQKRMLVNVVQSNANGAILVPSVGHSVTDLKAEAYGVETQHSLAPPQEQQPLSPEAKEVQDELQRGPEIAM